MEIFQVLINPILPVFATLGLGFYLGRTGRATEEQARTVNWVATAVLLPILVLGLVSNAPIKEFSVAPLLSYLIAEVLLAGFALWLAIRLGLEKQEAVLMAIGCVFVNNAFLVLPISQFLYGTNNVDPIIAVLTLDTIVLFAGFLFALEFMKPGRHSPGRVLGMLVRLPLIQTIAVGLILNFFDIELPDCIQTFVDFNGQAAAPLALFALGVVLSQISFRPDRVVWVFTGLKMVVFPLTVWAMMSLITPISPEDYKFFLSAAGPITTAVFSFGMLYGVPTTRIAQMLVLTTILSLISLAVFA